MSDSSEQSRLHWLNRSLQGIGLASLFTDYSHEVATTVRERFEPLPKLITNSR